MSEKKILCRFTIGATSPAQFPASNLPEFAFVGRSNVGKSSLINALVGDDVCRVSKTPGRTQQVNFFDTILQKQHFTIVDLPGYGYATVSKQMRDNWNELIVAYLQRENLKKVFLLIDSRHGIKANDAEVMDLLDQLGVLYQLVFTKTDKIKSKQEKEEYAQCLLDTQEIIKQHPAAFPEIIETSVRSKLNVLYNAFN